MPNTEERKHYQRSYQRAYRRNNPDAILRHRITAAENLLERNGYTIIRPADLEQEGGEE